MAMSQAFLLGVVTGLRSQAALTVLVHEASLNPMAYPHIPELLRSSFAAGGTKLAAIGEIVGDKLPFTPNRTDHAPLFGRILFAAVVGYLVDQDDQVRGVAYGALGAIVGAYAGMILRRRIGHLYGIPDVVVALAEDGIAYGLARAWVRNGDAGRENMGA